MQIVCGVLIDKRWPTDKRMKEKVKGWTMELYIDLFDSAIGDNKKNLKSIALNL